MFQQFLPRDLKKEERGNILSLYRSGKFAKVSYLEIKNPVYVVLQNAFIVLS